MLDPQAGDEQREKIAADAKSKLEASGSIEHEANWGMRKMAYEIDNRPEADYRFYRFTTEGSALLDDLDHTLKITEGVLRFRIFKTEHDAPTMTPPDTEQIMQRRRRRPRPRPWSRRRSRRLAPSALGARGRTRTARQRPQRHRPRQRCPPRRLRCGSAGAAPAAAAPAEAAPEPAPALSPKRLRSPPRLPPTPKPESPRSRG